jgi:chorismate mutase / prephenate dehydratase
MTSRPNLKLAALGGPNTFGGDAAQRMRECYPEFSSIVYFPTEKEAADFANNGADAFCVPQQMARTGVHPGIQAYIARLDSKLYVIAEVIHAYHCSLLVKPGSKIAQIKRILGHTGSITQSRNWLTEHVPQAEIVIVHTSSQGAAQEVFSGDGSVASVGTPGMGREYGLKEAAKDIDGGSLGAYWAISPHRLFSEAPQRLVVAGRFNDQNDLSGLIGALAAQGFRLHTTYQSASGVRLYEYDYVLRFGGQGNLSGVEKALSAFPAARLAGAFEMPQEQ